MISYGRQSIDDGDVHAVAAALRADLITQGPIVAELEATLAKYTGAREAVVFSSGTTALQAACTAAGLATGDVVVTSPLSFVASASCAVATGASVRFVDIDPATLNLDPDAVPPEADAIVAVHYAGLPMDLTRLSARPRVVIEDAAHALGATTPDGPVGSCARSDLCCFSFHPVKAITTGEGGAVTTNSSALAERLRRFRHHGIEPRPHEGPWVYDVIEHGTNARLTDLQAALGLSQLSKIDAFLDRRSALADRYRTLLADTGVELPPSPSAGVRHAYHLFPVQVPERRRVYEQLRADGIGVQVHYVPTYRFSAYRGPDADPARFPATEAAYERLLSLPLYPLLTDEQQDHIVERLVGALDTRRADAR